MKKKGDICNLAELGLGQTAKVLKLSEENKRIRRHLLDMGVTRGVEITVKKIAPMGDPVDIALRDYELCICRADLSKIEVIVVVWKIIAFGVVKLRFKFNQRA